MCTDPNAYIIQTETYVKTYKNVKTIGLYPYLPSFKQIQYAEIVDFNKMFKHLISYNPDNNDSVALNDNLTKIIQRGNGLGLSPFSWEDVILEFARQFLPLEFPALCQFSGDVWSNELFFQVSLILEKKIIQGILSLGTNSSS